MYARYLFRLDDIAPTMDWERYERISQIFLEEGVKPLLAVIPNNQDPDLLRYPARSEHYFWREIHSKYGLGWHIAMHGHRHVLGQRYGNGGGSEFAGDTLDGQLANIRAGLSIFRSYAIPIRTFVAPRHSFDRNTLEALGMSGVPMVSDGYSLFPFRLNNILMIPQFGEYPRYFPCGLRCFCIHPNTASDRLVERLRQFIRRQKRNILSFDEVAQFENNGLVNACSGALILPALMLWRRLRQLLSGS